MELLENDAKTLIQGKPRLAKLLWLTEKTRGVAISVN